MIVESDGREKKAIAKSNKNIANIPIMGYTDVVTMKEEPHYRLKGQH
jgi:hypothetical protein